MTYPDAKRAVRGKAKDYPRDKVLNALQERVGSLRDSEPSSIEDRLYTVEMLLVDVLSRVQLPVVPKVVK